MFRRERRPLSALTWSDDRTFRLDDAEYVCRPFGNRVPSTSDRFCILKPRWSVLLYEQMLTELAPRNVVEVGIYDGGSTALFARLAQPQKLVAIDVKTTASPALEEYLDARRLRDTVATYYGVDQADTLRLTQILDSEFGTEPLDLVIDDASHAVAPTRGDIQLPLPPAATGRHLPHRGLVLGAQSAADPRRRNSAHCPGVRADPRVREPKRCHSRGHGQPRLDSRATRARRVGRLLRCRRAPRRPRPGSSRVRDT